MYENYYGLSAKPFQLRPDPHFFYGSQGHKRAMSYLDYGLAQGEGFIVITGEIGAGKTTLVRSMLERLPADKIVVAQLTNTYLNTEDTLRMVLASFGQPAEQGNKSALLLRLEQFLHQCEREGKRALLVVDEAQNLTPHTVEELRMLSNFHSRDQCLLQTFLLGQPEFRNVLHSPELRQLRQRVIATYHLGPLTAPESRAYIEHRLRTVNWRGAPRFTDAAHAAIYDYAGGIPRTTNHLCDRLMLMGYLEQLTTFHGSDVEATIRDIRAEGALAPSDEGIQAPAEGVPSASQAGGDAFASVDERLLRVERSVLSVLQVLKKIVAAPSTLNNLDHIE
ncbi:XrtA/PEP-CTERM system-associated ATPase [Duganella sp. P38]|uniref:XrtA/PEP-CTERM system-associated ATPase n=1 Tax=Duganella sp. P38 TaxID=3423949 RepID=UPI003D7BF3D7